MDRAQARIHDVMTTQVHTVRTTDSLDDAAVQMWNADVGVLPVVDPIGQVVGMISDRDIAMAAGLRGLRLAEIGVEGVMSCPVWACAPDATLADAEATMQEHRIRRLPVIDSSARLVGLVSLGDLGHAPTVDVCEHLQALGQTFAAITAPRRARLTLRVIA